MSEFLYGRGFYDREYFDPEGGASTKSNYTGYSDGGRHYLPMAGLLVGQFFPELLKRRGLRVLDIGCAKGFLVKSLNKIPFIEAFGLDFSDYALKNSPESQRENLVEADAAALPLEDQSFDLAIAFDVLEHLGEQGISEALSEARRILKPSSPFVVMIPTSEEKDKDISHVTIEPTKWWRETICRHGFSPIKTPVVSLPSTILKNHVSACQVLSRPGFMAFKKKGE